MPRFWDYTKARKIAMQVFLCAILGVSILFAWMINRRHAAEIIPTQFEPQTLGNLTVEAPKGWEVLQLGDQAMGFVETHGLLGVNRTISVRKESIRRSSNLSAKQAAVTQLGDLLGEEPFESVDFLGQHGVMVEIPARLDFGGYRAAFLCACVVLPSRQVVTVEMSGMHLVAPADYQLFKRILSSLQMAGGKGDTVAARKPLADLSVAAI